MKPKLNIFYRHYNITGNDGKHRPEWFSYEKCFINLLNTIKNDTRVNLYVIMDGLIDINWIEKYKEHFTSHEFTGGSDRMSFLTAYEYAKNLNTGENDLYYFLENDYLHVKGWVDKVFDLFGMYSNLNYISLYDHNDKYFLPMYQDLVSKIITTSTHHWRTTPSTCGTYIVNKKIFLEDYNIPFEMKGDHNKFLHLNQTKGRFVLTPLPGLSTHCMNNLLSPTIKWK